jgi:GAF domain-containing protein
MVPTGDGVKGDDALALVANLTTQSFRTTDEAIQAVLAVLQRITGLDTTLVSQIDRSKSELRVLAAHNAAPSLTVPAGLQIPLSMSPCHRVAGSDQPFISADMREDPELAVLPAAKDLGACAYVGVPVVLADGAFFGTLVGLNTAPQANLGQHLHWMQILAQLAAFQIERQRGRQS